MRTKQEKSAGAIEELSKVLIVLSAVSKRLAEHLEILSKRGE